MSKIKERLKKIFFNDEKILEQGKQESIKDIIKNFFSRLKTEDGHIQMAWIIRILSWAVIILLALYGAFYKVRSFFSTVG